MANALKGEVSFAIEGNPFALVYDFNALCTIEQELEVDVASVGEKLNSPTMIRSIFRIGLEAKHGALSDIEAGRMIHALGVERAANLVGEAFAAAFPAPGESAEGKAKPKKAGTGPAR